MALNVAEGPHEGLVAVVKVATLLFAPPAVNVGLDTVTPPAVYPVPAISATIAVQSVNSFAVLIPAVESDTGPAALPRAIFQVPPGSEMFPAASPSMNCGKLCPVTAI